MLWNRHHPICSPVETPLNEFPGNIQANCKGCHSSLFPSKTDVLRVFLMCCMYSPLATCQGSILHTPLLFVHKCYHIILIKKNSLNTASLKHKLEPTEMKFLDNMGLKCCYIHVKWASKRYSSSSPFKRHFNLFLFFYIGQEDLQNFPLGEQEIPQGSSSWDGHGWWLLPKWFPFVGVSCKVVCESSSSFCLKVRPLTLKKSDTYATWMNRLESIR